jgi:hypothetical protein
LAGVPFRLSQPWYVNALTWARSDVAAVMTKSRPKVIRVIFMSCSSGEIGSFPEFPDKRIKANHR